MTFDHRINLSEHMTLAEVGKERLRVVAPLRSKANGESEEGENRRNYRLRSSAGWVMKVVAP